MIERIKDNIKTTTVGAISAAIVIIIKIFGIDVPEAVITAILTVIVAVLGLFAKD